MAGSEQKVIELKPFKFDISFDVPGSKTGGQTEGASRQSKHATSCTAFYKMPFESLPNAWDSQKYEYIFRGPASVLIEGDVTVFGRLHLEYKPYSTISHTISVGFSAAQEDVRKRSAASREEASQPPGCQTESVILTSLLASGKLGIELPPISTREPYAWTLNSEYNHVLKLSRGMDNAMSGLQIQLRFKPSAPQHIFSFFVRDLGLPKTLLGNANKSGDLNLICKDGSKVPAHSAVLDTIPYFEAKIKDDWSGTGWNKTKKLDLELPYPVNQGIMETFLKYAYGDVGVLYQIEASDASTMQDLFLLAEACGFSRLCSDIEEIITVDATSASSWLELLSKVHAEGVCKIREKVKEVVKVDFSQTELWDDLSVEQLTALEGMARKHKARKLEH